MIFLTLCTIYRVKQLNYYNNTFFNSGRKKHYFINFYVPIYLNALQCIMCPTTVTSLPALNTFN